MASLHHFIITSLLLLLLLSPNLSSASISTTLTQPLSGKKRLISQSGNFELGFFQPANSSCYYMGIWYNLDKISPLTSVWVANRDNPITDPTTAELKISADGNLVLSNNSINPIVWSTNLTTTSNLTTVVSLLDTGNLVIKDGSDSNITLWQSFDHPTDTWLPGGKLGLNKLTGELQHLVSWKSQNDPASGVFSLEVDPNGTSEYFLLWNNSYKYWNTGTWNGKIFSLLPEMTGNNGYTFQYVSNDHENYFTYSVTAADIITRLILDVSGQVEQLLWVDGSREWIAFWSQPRAQCQVHALCGPFGSCNENDMPLCSCVKGFREKLSTNWDLGDRTGGCVRNTPLSPQCAGNGSYQTEKEDGFFPMSNMRLPDNAKTLLQVGSESDCGQECLQTCSCTAYSYSSSSSSTGGCLVWHGDLLNLQEEYVGRGGGTLFLRLSANDINSNPKRRKGKIAAAAVIGGGVVVLLLLTILVIVWLLISKRRGILMGKFSVVQGGLVVFKFTDLQRATKNFTVKLGGGGFGAVFRGVLQEEDSTVVAVKKLEGVQQGEKQFRAEVSTIGTIQHVNLIRLRGFCSEGSHKLLVYEYMPGGSLDTHLFKQYSSAGGEVLGWKTRYLIALGIARALTYLHEHCRDCIIHCDIKPENILLDASFVPKLADFGLAKLLGRDLSRVLTTMRGTRGYLAPEWFAGVEITAKADVYSYGMMLFEIISGKRNLDETEEERPGFFPTLAARKLMDGDELVSLLDCEMDSSDVNSAEVVRACKVACWCIQDHENSRPTMSQVIQILEGVLEVNMPPIPRSLQILVENPGSVILS